MRTAVRELIAVCVAACRREGSLPGLLKAWASIHVSHTTATNQPIPYRLVD